MIHCYLWMNEWLYFLLCVLMHVHRHFVLWRWAVIKNTVITTLIHLYIFIIKIQTKTFMIFSYFVARDIHILTKLWGLWAWCVRSLCDLKSQLRSFEQFAAADFARTIVHDHPRSPATSRAISLRYSHDFKIFMSQLGRNMVVSPVWLGLCVVVIPKSRGTFESDIRTRIGQNGISSGVGRQDLKFLLCYLSEGRRLFLNTRNNSGGLAIARHKFPDRMEWFKTVGKLFPSCQLGMARMSVASPSQIGRKSLEDSYVTRHGRKSVASHLWVTYDRHRSDIGST